MANVVALAAVAAWILSHAYPPTRGVRLRNAWLGRVSALNGFGWKADDAPCMFRRETRRPSPAFAEAVASLDLRSCTGDWNRALRVAEHLAIHARDLGPIQADLETTYARIRRGYGYCADFVKVFMGLAHAAGLFSRQWAFSFDGFGGHGHTIVEVFDRGRGKWLFLDVYNNFHACNAVTGEPLGALEFRDALLNRQPAITLQPNGSGRAGYPLQHKLFDYYERGLQQWYLICGNAVFSYDAHPLVRWMSRFSGSLGQIVATILDVHPPIQVLATSENARLVQQLMVLRHRFRIALAVACILALLLFWQLVTRGMAAR